MSDEKYDGSKAQIKLGDQTIASFNDVKIIADGVYILDPIIHADQGIPAPYVPLDTPKIENNNNVDPVELENYVKEYFEKCFKEDNSLKVPEKVFKEMKIPTVGELSQRKLKLKEE